MLLFLFLFRYFETNSSLLWKDYLIPTFEPGKHIAILQFICNQIEELLRRIFIDP